MKHRNYCKKCKKLIKSDPYEELYRQLLKVPLIELSNEIEDITNFDLKINGAVDPND